MIHLKKLGRSIFHFVDRLLSFLIIARQFCYTERLVIIRLFGTMRYGEKGIKGGDFTSSS